MAIQASVQKNVLQFKFDARTSRGAMQQHVVYYFKIWNEDFPEITGIGECAPLPGLSPEYGPDFENWLNQWVSQINLLKLPADKFNSDYLTQYFKLQKFPSVRFGLETAALDLQQNGRKQLFNNFFSRSEDGIPINGLIWMGNQQFMQEQIAKKLNEGFTCLKLKIGGLDFNTELEILREIRKMASSAYLTIRLDANGAFTPQNALGKLNNLAEFNIHSIEQPIKAGQISEMVNICASSPIPVALDEELIGVITASKQNDLLSTIKPQYIILKPTLLGGFKATHDWITLAKNRGIGWWITSALESNIGLNAISQFTAEYNPNMEQGLGTGQLYHNNVKSPLLIKSGKLFYNTQESWGEI